MIQLAGMDFQQSDMWQTDDIERLIIRLIKIIPLFIRISPKMNFCLKLSCEKTS
ncbi:hypothetical protein [Oceanobacillus caeni]|uniref:hypothetical protein n=1 Tax=Oceanobacillus caeni TaxID=405946 RepID=UPI0030B8B277